MKKLLSSVVISSVVMTTLIPNIAQAESTKSLNQYHIKNTNQIDNIIDKLPGLNKNGYKNYKIIKVEKDELGFTHYTLKPKFKKVDIADKEIKIHVDKNGKIVFINGDLTIKKLSELNKMLISESAAIDSAFKAIGYSKDEVSDLNNEVVKSVKSEFDVEFQKYIYNININYISPEPANWFIKVDAQTGEILEQKNILHSINTTGQGLSLNKTYKPINIVNERRINYLVDNTTSTQIATYNAANTTDTFNIMTDYDKYFTSNYQAAGVDAHDYAKKIYDYYKNTHGRQSYDNQNGTINSIVHYGRNYNNAFWSGSVMVYGDGDNNVFSSLSGANDVVAHELTHAVTQSTANLNYENQPGALNESMSDVFAYFIDPDFLIGEDVYTPNRQGDALRSISNPELYGQPSTMSNYRYLPNTEEGDFGGVHYNSGIPNKAFYYTVSSLGKVKSEKIYYRALTYYLTPTSNFMDAKKALIQSAQDLYGYSEVNAIEKAWDQVGVY